MVPIVVWFLDIRLDIAFLFFLPYPGQNDPESIPNTADHRLPKSTKPTPPRYWLQHRRASASSPRARWVLCRAIGFVGWAPFLVSVSFLGGWLVLSLFYALLVPDACGWSPLPHGHTFRLSPIRRVDAKRHEIGLGWP